VSSKWRVREREKRVVETGVRSCGERAGSRASQYLLQTVVVGAAADGWGRANPAETARTRGRALRRQRDR
jgi:hypothetical protein